MGLVSPQFRSDILLRWRLSVVLKFGSDAVTILLRGKKGIFKSELLHLRFSLRMVFVSPYPDFLFESRKIDLRRISEKLRE